MTVGCPARIVIAGHLFGFPNGYGASGRISAYARGLSALGAEVTILCLKPSEMPMGPRLNAVPQGEYCGAHFAYTSGTSISSTYRLMRYLLNVRGVLGAIAAISRLKKGKRIDALLLYGTTSIAYSILLFLLAKWSGAVFLGEETEARFTDDGKGLIARFRKRIYKRVICRLFDGFIVISHYLFEKYQPLLRTGVPLVILPIMVNLHAFFRQTQGEISQTPIVMYSGDLKRQREVSAAIQIWSIVAAQNPTWVLHILGGLSDLAIMRTIQRQLASYGLEENIRFRGLIARDALPDVLSEASILILPREKGLFSTAGLPNKLGEYLATGKPVITTDVGDISLYVRDGYSAYLVPPGDWSVFADRLSSVINHMEEAREIGLRGQAVAQLAFNDQEICRKLLGMVQTIKRGQ